MQVSTSLSLQLDFNESLGFLRPVAVDFCRRFSANLGPDTANRLPSTLPRVLLVVP